MGKVVIFHLRLACRPEAVRETTSHIESNEADKTYVLWHTMRRRLPKDEIDKIKIVGHINSSSIILETYCLPESEDRLWKAMRKEAMKLVEDNWEMASNQRLRMLEKYGPEVQ